MKVFDLFCGGGGFSRGVSDAGGQVVLAVDIDPILSSAHERNFPASAHLLADVRELSGKALTGKYGVPDGVVGGPPCQGFSSIGRRAHDDPRRELLSEFFRLVSEISPAFFVMENVAGLIDRSNAHVIPAALSSLAGRYEILPPTVIDAADYGCATRRRRVFVIGYDPERMARPNPFCPTSQAAATVRDAIWDLCDARHTGVTEEGFDVWTADARRKVSLYAERLRGISREFTGHRKTEHSDAVRRRFAELAPGKVDRIGRHPKLAWDGQCPTLRAGTGSDLGSYQSVRPIHPDQPRVITVREAARLQGFPDCHMFHPTIWHSFRMIGNSVPPILAAAIMTEIRGSRVARMHSVAAE